jgi:hypothetical protein
VCGCRWSSNSAARAIGARHPTMLLPSAMSGLDL